MADRNLADYLQAVNDSNGRVVGDALRTVGGATRPTDADLSAGTLFWNTGSTALDLYNGTTWLTVATGAGGGGIPTWDDVYTNDKTLNINDTTFTITVSAAIAGFTFNKTNVGAGAVIAITNAGTGNDITGNAGNWSVTAAGALTVASVASAGAITCTAISDVTAGATLQVDGNAAGGVNIGSTSTGAITLGRATTITTGGLTVSDTGITVSDGITDLIDNSNVASGLRLTNDTVTTYGAGGVSTGVVLLRSTSLTTGSLLSLQLTEGTLDGGFYLRCFDVTGGANVFTLGEDGAIVITGVGAANVLTLTAGDAVLSDGSLTITDADNAATVSVTNNTATTAQVSLVTGSGVFTGTGATSFFGITQSGATSGDVVAVTVNGLTTGNALLLTSSGTIVDGGAMLSIVANSATTAGATAGGLVEVSADALTTGWAMDVNVDSLALAAGGLFNTNHTVSGTIAAAKTGQMNDFFSSRTHTAATAISDDYDLVRVIRAGVINNAGGTLNSAGSVLYVQNTATQTAGTMADTVIGVEVVMSGGAEAQGAGVSITHSGTTVGSALVIAASQTTANAVSLTADAVTTGIGMTCSFDGLTEGEGVFFEHTTSVITTGSVVRITSTGIDTGTGQGTLLDLVSSGTTAAEVVSLVADALATGIGFYTSFDGLTTGEGMLITHTTSVIADGGSLFRLSSTGIDTGGATNGTVFDLSSTAQLAGVVSLETCSALTTGTAHRIVANAVTTGILLDLETSAAGMAGSYIRCFDGAANDFVVGADGATTITGVAASTVFTVTAGDISIADGSITLVDADNANTVSIVNDTATTIGAAANAGMVDISGDGLTTGTALNIGLTEGTLTTGRYLKCWDVTGGVEVAAIEEDGELFVAGGRATTAGGADAINIGASAAIKIAWGSGAPTYTAPQGSVYMRTDGSSTSTRLYVNTDGAGTWTNVTTAA